MAAESVATVSKFPPCGVHIPGTAATTEQQVASIDRGLGLVNLVADYLGLDTATMIVSTEKMDGVNSWINVELIMDDTSSPAVMHVKRNDPVTLSPRDILLDAFLMAARGR